MSKKRAVRAAGKAPKDFSVETEPLTRTPIYEGRTAAGTPVIVRPMPGFSKAYVNWRADPSGKLVEVLFTEDVDLAFASNAANWSTSGGPSVASIAIRERNHYRVTLSSALTAACVLSESAKRSKISCTCVFTVDKLISS